MTSRKKRGLSVWLDHRVSLLVLSACYLLGGLIGCLLSGFTAGTDGLRHYINRYITASLQGEVALRFLPMVFDTIRIPLLVLVFGFSFLGLLGIPILFALQGLRLCFSVSAFVSFAGLSGLAASFLLFGISTMMWTPALFVLGEHCVRCSYRVLCHSSEHRGIRRLIRDLLPVSCLCFVFILFSVLVEFWLVPALLPALGLLL